MDDISEISPFISGNNDIQAGGQRVRFPTGSLEFFGDIILPDVL